MTNKEASFILANIDRRVCDDELNEALDMAIKALDQEPCEMTAEEYRQRMIQAFHNADTDELIAICVLPTEKEFEHLEWLLKNHYKKEPCGDAIDRSKAIMIASGYCHPANVAKELAKLPPVTPQPKTGERNTFELFQSGIKETWYECPKCKWSNALLIPRNYCPNCGCRMVEPQESEDDEQIKVGTKVRTIKDKDFAGEEVFPVETIGIVEEIRKGGKLPYIIRANSDYWYYSRDMFEVIEDIEPQERSDKE